MSILRWLRSQALLLVALTSFGLVIVLNSNAMHLSVAKLLDRQTLAAPIIRGVPSQPSTSQPTPVTPSMPKIDTSQPPHTEYPIPSAPSELRTLQHGSMLTSPQITSPQLPKLGHFPYPQADVNTLVVVGKYDQRVEKLAPEAGMAWKQLVSAARESGVLIVPISGFRSIETQTALFRDRARQRGLVGAAKSVAPPGYSEHHTGYAIDLGDGRAPYSDVTPAFAKTAAFRWLTKHAQEYGFELSFPLNNPQHVIYEPWHWRFVGSPDAIRVFAAARHRNQS
jgi:D-alanyl-D-alanine carboxypeptidase